MKSINIRVTGSRPILMHSDRLSDPLDPITKEYKALTSKRKRTDEENILIAQKSWAASMYYDPAIGPYIPGVMLEASIISGGKLSKLGAQLKRSIEVLEDKCKLEYDGPRDMQSLWDQRFYDARSVKVMNARLMRYRPVFKNWATEFTIAYDEDAINFDQVVQCLEAAGMYCGIGDYRPKFGRYNVEVL